ncbi:mannose-1-phosphate guanylyltransferase/mannose-6-phosphate isomerase [Chelativorans sp.]|uniref:mannose-1-phosphate guanylyltransferase/mannose-6-phosphate isomerase n=1 Tax=Chelativorans sp. TaxID=2203393 RepID=UPI002811477E|nr:mannose-1-phosphate guanylyltransferase/mannose-6-phosphate isomerase [Chelativorans sp.]
MNIIPVIISGGAGSRLWPLSREAHPKPFIRLPDGSTLIGRTYARVAALGVERVVTVTNRELLFLTSDAYAEAKAPKLDNTFLLEPFGRDTAPAVALATVHAAATQGTEAVLLVLPADHLIQDEQAFATAVERGVALARTGRIVTFGIVPERPETGYGYIEVDGEDVIRFIEKPNAEKAAEYVASGRTYWNSGMFCFSAATMLKAMQDHCPEVLSGARAAYEAARRIESDGRTAYEVDRQAFGATPAISVDYAVMEKAGNIIACVPTDCGWSDIGSWAAISDLVAADESGNRITGEAVVEGAKNCFVHAEDRLVGLVGVSDLLVIDTPDALLVAHKDKAQDVKHLYNRLRSEEHEAAKLHRTAHRPWGTYTVLEEGDRFKIKRIVVKPGARLSLQAHHHRSEHWVVVSGTARVTNGDNVILLTTNQSTYIPCGFRHRLENPGILPLVLIEVQSGDYLEEDDIVRFDDVYGRP